MIVFRQTDVRYPFLWEDNAQPAGRWHGHGEGPAHYFADTPDGAWAEFLRHEEIADPDDLATIRRRMWAVDVGEAHAEPVGVPDRVATGNLDTYPRCQAEARRLRAAGARRLLAPSAALVKGAARGTIVRGGPQAALARDGRVVVVFGVPGSIGESIVGWVAADAARPPADLLERVHHYRSR
jgi:hypothetical protein